MTTHKGRSPTPDFFPPLRHFCRSSFGLVSSFWIRHWSLLGWTEVHPANTRGRAPSGFYVFGAWRSEDVLDFRQKRLPVWRDVLLFDFRQLAKQLFQTA